MNISTIVIPFLIVSIMAFLNWGAKRPPKSTHDSIKILRLPVFVKIMSGISIAGAGLLLYIGLISVASDEIILVVICFVFLLLMGIYLLLMGTRYKVELTAQGITQTTMYGKQKQMVWSEIKAVKFDKLTSELMIKSADTLIKVHIHMVGFTTLLDEIEARTNFTKLEMGIPTN